MIYLVRRELGPPVPSLALHKLLVVIYIQVWFGQVFAFGLAFVRLGFAAFNNAEVNLLR